MRNKTEAKAFADAQSINETARSLGWPTFPKPTPITRELVIEWEKKMQGKKMPAFQVDWRAWTIESAIKIIEVNLDLFERGFPFQESTFQTREMALLSLRWSWCEEAAKKLHRIDTELTRFANIDEELKKENP